ncbi:helix-turn-helix transcriptional regulator [Brevundimonas sp.]|jgi:transcriptional regulator with XRE-family HTH domain|uniref:helix-turn-helix domain-containing protein n=1 Tax=Brevundimonas sp. TaxID=1871086 RepID=UPI00262342DB|nr:helix-turn-helix transcriptional regulator [Brevundimonas sp.]
MPDRVPSPRYRAIPAWMSSSRHRLFIEALVEARKSAGLTQRDLAAKLKKPQSFVAKVEAIERNLSVLEFVDWADAIGITPASLLTLLDRENEA